MSDIQVQGKMTFRRGSLALRYSIIFFVGLLTIFLIAFIYTYYFSTKILLEEGRKDAANITDLTIARIENILLPIQMVPRNLVKAIETPQINDDEVMRLAREFVIESPEVFGSCMAYEPYAHSPKEQWYAPYVFETATGVMFKNLGNTSYDYFNKDWYRLPKLLNRPVWTEPYYDKGGGEAFMCTYSVPFYKTVKGKKVFSGVLTMDISLIAFERIINSVRVYKSGYAFLVSGKGMIINSRDLTAHNENIMEVVKKGKGANTIKAVGEMLLGKRGFVKVDGLKSKKDPSFLYYAPVATSGWSIGLIFPEKELFSDFIGFFRQLIIIFAVCVFSILLTTILITRRLTTPISRLVDATYRIGQGDFNAPLPIHRSRDEISQLTNAFSVMQEELATYLKNLQETTIAKEKIESELNVAHTIQMGMLPTGFPVRKDCDLFAELESAKAVGGDLYDFFFLDEDHLCFAVGDVAGKGVPAALFMSVMRTMFRANISLDLPLNDVICRINQALGKENPNEMFVTFWAGIIDLRSGEILYCNAGHNYPYMVRKDGLVERMPQTNGLPLGVYENTVYVSQQRFILPGETVVLYTDGITEAINISGEFYGEERLKQVLMNSGKLSAKEMGLKLSANVRTFASGTEQADDITILVLTYQGSDADNNISMDNMKLTLVNRLGELEKVVAAIETLTEQWGLPSRVGMELNLVLEELFTNIVFYAFEDGTEHELSVEFERSGPGLMKIRMEDDGKPFNLLDKDISDLDTPLEERKIGGLGIHFVKEMMDKVEYERAGNKNVVLLTKKY
ncbi:MAG: SpoIIE family protein phosphatase [bacterium]